MDTFDGFFAEKDKMFKAMKDSRVGSFGVQSIIIITLLQLASFIKINNQIINVLPICLFWGRFSTLIYIDRFKYIANKNKSISHKKYWRGFRKESTYSILFLILLIFYNFFSANSQQNLIHNILLISAGIFSSITVPFFLGRKFGGFTGDTCGASVVITETIILFIHGIFL